MSDLGNKEIFAKNLKYYMEINNKSRTELCKTLGFAYTTFSDWYNAKIYPGIDKIEMLANYFNIKKSDLIENKDNDFRYASFDGAYLDVTGLSEEEIEELKEFVEFAKKKKKLKEEMENKEKQSKDD